tara:strand:+ start:3250 stop:3753 length:504 start_codon:yes stop_codon:yes gene_type:complete
MSNEINPLTNRKRIVRMKSKVRPLEEDGKPKNIMAWRMKNDPEFVKMMHKKQRDKRTKTGRKIGIPNGVTVNQFRKSQKIAKKEARIIVSKITKADEDIYAKEALEASVEILRTPEISVDHKLKSAKLVLDFTKSRPATTTELTIHKAEAFLESVLDSEENDGQKVN